MEASQTIAIIGGGVSGALAAYHLHRLSAPVKIVIVEPRVQLGLGLAYSTTCRSHLLNVPAEKISALPHEPDHFLEWLRQNYDPSASAGDFIPRSVFGRYIQSLASAIIDLDHRQTTAVQCKMVHDKAELLLGDGTQITADKVVLALGNFDPGVIPGVSAAAEALGLYRHSAWTEEAYDGLDPTAPVTLIGTGLTAVDVLLKLRERGHEGLVTMVSRHGLLPNRHCTYNALGGGISDDFVPRTARGLLQMVRKELNTGSSWRAVIDSLRGRTNEFWLALPGIEQRRFRRHLLRRWEVIRHRMAPAIGNQVEAELKQGTLTCRRGKLERVDLDARGARVHVRTHDGDALEIEAARVINCTGPEMNYRRVESPLLRDLFRKGLAVPGPLAIALWSEENGALRAADESISKILFTIGPGRLGRLLESIAVPEIREQAWQLASELTDQAKEFARTAPKKAA